MVMDLDQQEGGDCHDNAHTRATGDNRSANSAAVQDVDMQAAPEQTCSGDKPGAKGGSMSVSASLAQRPDNMCIRHRRMADEGATARLQKVRCSITQCRGGNTQTRAPMAGLAAVRRARPTQRAG